jgi:cation:H+ antiporter
MMPWLAMIAGFALLLWGAERFVEGAAATARHLGMDPLLIGIIIVGFGTSAPEMLVSAMAALDGNPDLALGNAYGSNIINTGLILGLTALIAPILVHSSVVSKELPLLLVICAVSGAMLWDGSLSRLDATLLLAGFIGLIAWSIVAASRNRIDALADEVVLELDAHSMTLRAAIFWLLAGLALLLLSSRLLVWGAVLVAQSLGISDLVIGLTVVALGTSLPELAASVVAARKGEHDIAIGNVVGSNMFNLLAVVGIASMISPMTSIAPEVLARDWTTTMGLSIALVIFAYGFGRQGRINRWEGTALLVGFVAYTSYLIFDTTR